MFGAATKVLNTPVPPYAKFIPYFKCLTPTFLNLYGIGDFTPTNLAADVHFKNKNKISQTNQSLSKALILTSISGY